MKADTNKEKQEGGRRQEERKYVKLIGEEGGKEARKNTENKEERRKGVEKEGQEVGQ